MTVRLIYDSKDRKPSDRDEVRILATTLDEAMAHAQKATNAVVKSLKKHFQKK